MPGPEDRKRSFEDVAKLLDSLGLNPFTAPPPGPSDEQQRARDLSFRREQQQRDLDNAPRPKTWQGN
jgi:hypothetical protein